MKKITVRISHSDLVQNYYFLFNSDQDNVWNARLLDETNTVIERFESETLLQSMDQLSMVLFSLGRIVAVSGDSENDGHINLLKKMIRQNQSKYQSH